MTSPTLGPAQTGKPARPREVRVGGMMAVVGSLMALMLTISGMSEINSKAMKDTLRDLVNDPRFDMLDLTLDEATTLMRWALMSMGALSVVSLVLGIYVLRGHRASRVALTAVGAVVVLVLLLSGPPGWVLATYVAVSVGLLWTGNARRWFSPPQQQQVLQPPSTFGGWGSPPPPPPPPRR